MSLRWNAVTGWLEREVVIIVVVGSEVEMVWQGTIPDQASTLIVECQNTIF